LGAISTHFGISPCEARPSLKRRKIKAYKVPNHNPICALSNKLS
jgi:hypothetical protein